MGNFQAEKTASEGTPALAYPYVIYRASDGLYITRCYGIGQYGEGQWTEIGTKVTGTTSSSRNPSTLYDPWKGTYLTHLTWDEDGSLFYRNMTYSSGYQWSSRETVSSGFDFVSHTYPSLSMDFDGKIWITWEYKDDEAFSYRIYVRKRLGTNSYGSISSFGAGNGSVHPYYLRPSISGNRQKNSNNDISVVWYKSTNEVQKTSYVSGAWGSISTLSSSNQTPQLVYNETGMPFTNKLGFSRSTSGSYLPLTPISFAEGGGPLGRGSSQTPANQYTRGVITMLDSIAHMVEFGNIQLKKPDEKPMLVALKVLPDTIPLNNTDELVSYLESQPFVAYGESEVSLELRDYPLRGKAVELGNKDITYRLEFVENVGEVLIIV